MAVDLSSLAPDDGAYSATKRVAMDATAGNVVEVTLPAWPRQLTVTFRGSDGTTATTGAMAWSGTDGAAQDVDAFPIGSGGAYSRRLSPGRSAPPSGLTVYLSCGVNSGYAYLDLEG